MAEVGEVGGERGDEFLVGAGVAGEGSAGADLGVGGVEFGAYGGGQPVREDAAVGQRLGPLRERAVQGVVAAEDQVGQGGQPAAGEGGVSVTMPVGGWRPAAMAAQPAVAVVATEPRAPMNQTPVRPATCARSSAPAGPMASGRPAVPARPGASEVSGASVRPGVSVRPSRSACAVTGCLLGGWVGVEDDGRGKARASPARRRQRRLPYFEGSSFSWMLRKDTWSSAPWFWRPM